MVGYGDVLQPLGHRRHGLLTGEFGTRGNVYIYAFCSTIIFFKLLWFLLEEITTTHESIYLEQRVARRCLTTFQIVYLYKSLKT